MAACPLLWRRLLNGHDVGMCDVRGRMTGLHFCCVAEAALEEYTGYTSPRTGSRIVDLDGLCLWSHFIVISEELEKLLVQLSTALVRLAMPTPLHPGQLAIDHAQMLVLLFQGSLVH